MRILLVLLLVSLLSGCGASDIRRKDEVAGAAALRLAEVHRERQVLVAELLGLARRHGIQEGEVLTDVERALERVGSSAGQGIVDPSFHGAEAGLGDAVAALMLATDRYPELRADPRFLQLQSALAVSANQLKLTRQQYLQAARDYNTTISTFPRSLVAMALGQRRRPLLEDDAAPASDPDQQPAPPAGDTRSALPQ